MNNITIGALSFAPSIDGAPLLIAGPCVLEEEELVLPLAEHLAAIARRLEIPYVFKASFDKANRSSLHSPRGPGLERGLALLSKVRKTVGCPVLTDIHECHQVSAAAPLVDCLQIPAFLCRQTDLLLAAGRSARAVNIKKGQFLAAEDMIHPIEKVRSTGNQQILLTERGTFFGYGRLVVDFSAFATLREHGVPLIFDATHSVQRPGGLGDRSGGDRTLVPQLARAACAVGVHGLFFEVHPDPDHAPSDGPNMVPLAHFEDLLEGILRIRSAL